MIQICHLFVSPGHNFVGHHGQEPESHPILEVDLIECVAGQGIRGDRYFGFKPDFKGQITFFSMDVLDGLRRELHLPDVPPSATRRNVMVRGVDLNTLIGREFEVQGVRMFGVEECRPCYWMNRAIGAGAEPWLQGRAGLRAKIMSDGVLRRAP